MHCAISTCTVHQSNRQTLMLHAFFFLMIPLPPTSTLFPYTTLFRSHCSFPVTHTGGKSFPSPGSPSAFLASIQIGKHTSELQSRRDLVCRLLLEKKKYGFNERSLFQAVHKPIDSFQALFNVVNARIV